MVLGVATEWALLLCSNTQAIFLAGNSNFTALVSCMLLLLLVRENVTLSVLLHTVACAHTFLLANARYLYLLCVHVCVVYSPLIRTACIGLPKYLQARKTTVKLCVHVCVHVCMH